MVEAVTTDVVVSVDMDNSVVVSVEKLGKDAVRDFVTGSSSTGAEVCDSASGFCFTCEDLTTAKVIRPSTNRPRIVKAMSRRVLFFLVTGRSGRFAAYGDMYLLVSNPSSIRRRWSQSCRLGASSSRSGML